MAEPVLGERARPAGGQVTGEERQAKAPRDEAEGTGTGPAGRSRDDEDGAAPARGVTDDRSGPPAGEAGAIVSARGLTRRFGKFLAVDNVSFDLARGKVFGFLGPNGSGKSTTIRMLTGLLAPSSGTATGFGGLDVVRDTERWKQRLGYMSQKFSLYLDLTVGENLRFFGAIYGLTPSRIEGRIAALAARLQFEPMLDRLAQELSTGQRQRASLAAALLHEPELLFLDEPTGGVDPRGRRLFWDLIYELTAARGMTVLVTTHYMDEAEQCDRIAFILEGTIIAQGTPRELKRDLTGRILEVPAPDDPFEALASVGGDPALEDVYLFGARLRGVAHPGRSADAAKLLQRIGRATVSEPSLEDVFVSLARRRRAETERQAAGAPA